MVPRVRRRVADRPQRGARRIGRVGDAAGRVGRLRRVPVRDVHRDAAALRLRAVGGRVRGPASRSAPRPEVLRPSRPGGPLGELAVEQCLASLPDGIEALVPVPLARERERERGFNQAALLARRIGRRLEVPIRPRWLARIRPTRPQSDLSAAERRANVRGAFRASPRVAGRHVLVVDDILTTGSTLDACARALREAGAFRVGVLTVARVVHAAV